jgi:hypothetical protein
MERLSQSELGLYDYICKSGLTNLILNLTVPYQAMLDEVTPLLDRFVEHRSTDGRGWKSLSLWGANSTTTTSDDSSDVSGYGWTGVSNMLPVAKHFFNTSFPCKPYRRIRYMLLEPNGFIIEHRDAKTNKLDSAVNFCLSHSDKIDSYLNDYNISWRPGEARLLNLTNKHYIIHNDQMLNRVHMIYHGVQQNHNNPEWIRLVNESYKQHIRKEMKEIL